MVCNLSENILDNYVGVGDYDDYRIEYRLPRAFVTPDKIRDFLYFEPYNPEQMETFKKLYADYYMIKPDEDEKARKLMLEKKLEFNRYKKF